MKKNNNNHIQNIWEAFAYGELKKFCKENKLSYNDIVKFAESHDLGILKTIFIDKDYSITYPLTDLDKRKLEIMNWLGVIHKDLCKQINIAKPNMDPKLKDLKDHLSEGFYEAINSAYAEASIIQRQKYKKVLSENPEFLKNELHNVDISKLSLKELAAIVKEAKKNKTKGKED